MELKMKENPPKFEHLNVINLNVWDFAIKLYQAFNYLKSHLKIEICKKSDIFFTIL